jgi:glycosyltransferase involved in cell wall biosynthesis
MVQMRFIVSLIRSNFTRTLYSALHRFSQRVVNPLFPRIHERLFVFYAAKIRRIYLQCIDGEGCIGLLGGHLQPTDQSEIALIDKLQLGAVAGHSSAAQRNRVLIVDWKPPTPDRDSGSCRMVKIIACLQDAGVEIDFVGDREAEDSCYEDQLRPWCTNVLVGRMKAIEHICQHGNTYRLALLARPEIFERYAPLVREFAPSATLAYDTVDLHWVRFSRKAKFAENEAMAKEITNKTELFKRLELANAQSADVTIAITEPEKCLLLQEVPKLNVLVLPNIHEIAADIAPLENRSGIFFIGGFDHEPNVEAVKYFVSAVLPKVLLQLPDICFYVVGSNMPSGIRSLASSHVITLGYVEDVAPCFARCRVFVAPLLYGAGMKGKVGQSLAFGLPVVTTTIGAEGIGLIDGDSALIRDDADGLAAAIVDLHTNPVLWKRLSEQGLGIVRQRYSMDAVRAQVLSLLEER